LFLGVGVVTFAWLIVILCWPNSPFVLMFDDAFYYFTIARNLVRGMGSTFDGINPTNGYHPLWMGVCMIIYRIGFDGTLAARILLAIQSLAFGGALGLLALAVTAQMNGWQRLVQARPELGTPSLLAGCSMAVASALVVWGLNPLTAYTFINGLESGLVVLLDCALLYLALRWHGDFLVRTTRRDRLGVSVLLALLFLARTDAALLFGCLGLWCLFRLDFRTRCSWLPLFELFTLPAFTLVVYLVANWWAFGSFMQVSGLVKAMPLNLGNAVPFGLLLAGAVIWMFLRSRRMDRPAPHNRFPRVIVYLTSTAWFAGFCLLIIGYYGFLQNQQWLWYDGPVLIYLIGLYVLAMTDMVESALLELSFGGSPTRALATVSGVLILPMAVYLVYEVQGILDTRAGATQLADKAAGEWINQHLPEDTVLGSWDAGVIGYYAQRRVINLDGLVNSHAYYHAMRQQREGAFLTDEGLSMIVNHGDSENDRDPDLERYLRDWFGADLAAQASLVWMRPYQFKGTTVGSDGLRKGEREMAVFLYRLPELDKASFQ
jgi:hypothetical protein